MCSIGGTARFQPKQIVEGSGQYSNGYQNSQSSKVIEEKPFGGVDPSLFGKGRVKTNGMTTQSQIGLLNPTPHGTNP